MTDSDGWALAVGGLFLCSLCLLFPSVLHKTRKMAQRRVQGIACDYPLQQLEKKMMNRRRKGSYGPRRFIMALGLDFSLNSDTTNQHTLDTHRHLPTVLTTNPTGAGPSAGSSQATYSKGTGGVSQNAALLGATLKI